MVNSEDYEWINESPWWIMHCGNGLLYARTYNDGKRVLMHNVIMDSLWVDHIDSNGLNNQRNNLRLTTPTLNQANQRMRSDNTSGYRGVTMMGPYKWRARITEGGKRIHIGYYSTPEEAAKAFNSAAIELWGEHARLNEVN